MIRLTVQDPSNMASHYITKYQVKCEINWCDDMSRLLLVHEEWRQWSASDYSLWWHTFKENMYIWHIWKQCGCRFWPLTVVKICECCLIVPTSFVFYTINEKCQLEVGSIFYCGAGSWSRCVYMHSIVYTTAASFWMFSLVMFGWLYYIFIPTQYCNNSTTLCKPM